MQAKNRIAKFSKKHYVVIADVLQTEYRQTESPSKELAGIYRVAYNLADRLAQDNPRFDSAHFLAVVRGERDAKSKPQKIRADAPVDGCWRCEKGIPFPHTHDTSRPEHAVASCCIADGCGVSYNPATPETRNPLTLRSFWMRYCPKHRVDGQKHEPIIEKRATGVL